jgi:hypothetical protein
VAKYFFSIREQEKDGFKTVQLFVFSLKDGPNYQRSLPVNILGGRLFGQA